MEFGERLRRLRELRGMTLRQLADAVGVSEATIQRYECGVIKNPPRDRISAMADALGVPAASLAGWSDDELDEDVRLLARNLQQASPEVRKKLVKMVHLLLQDEDFHA